MLCQGGLDAPALTAARSSRKLVGLASGRPWPVGTSARWPGAGRNMTNAGPPVQDNCRGDHDQLSLKILCLHDEGRGIAVTIKNR